MIIGYSTFEVDPADLDEFDGWFLGLAENFQQEKGCVAYEVLTHPQDRRKRALFEVWEQLDDLLVGHRANPLHDELVARMKGEFGMKNVRDIVFDGRRMAHDEMSRMATVDAWE